ncbi:TonB-dependent receptor [Euzebyella marina]|uniref:TonB-dependent receptor n=1 Tax=Euzebyella marina TaxID=1761453 RepID=A0A3G2L5W3_9FLAO|nr:TonB-dependent receptor [Euzebyella marina]AYN67657.1 TonB-dependent receptor [Euzebyella marina]
MSLSFRFFILPIFLLIVSYASMAQNATLSGTVFDDNQVPVFGASVVLSKTGKGVMTDEAGAYSFQNLSAGTYKIQVSFIGYRTEVSQTEIRTNQANILNFSLKESTYNLNEVTVTGKSIVQQVKDKAFNVGVIDAKNLHHTSLDLAHALDRTSGIRVRESGGVGSQLDISLNGFRGNQVRFFIDGIPMENFGSAFQLNNIPVGLAERMEVYKGVVPISLGSDALGGAINIITNSYAKNHLDFSYSYGSFNTHRTIVNAIYVSPKSGFTVQANAFQNYSDNNYKMHVDVADINTGEYFRDQTVERFHDNYHNETVIAQLGVVNKPYADRLLIGATLGKNYREIQTGARVTGVFGAWHRKGNIIMPSLKYSKKNLFTKGLDVRLNANYNLGSEQNIDTLNRRYNWFGQFREYPNEGGERSYSLYKYKNNTGIATANFEYNSKDRHKFALSNTLNTFDRKGDDQLNPDNNQYDQPRKNLKNILGFGYTLEQEKYNVSIFAKNYFQQNKFTRRIDDENYGPGYEYVDFINTFSSLGYGSAASYFINDNLQIKASYEKSYRLPESNELFGDVINLQGNIDLKPEHSNNYNLGSSLWVRLNEYNQFNLNASGFYRDAKDFIRPRLNNNQVMLVMDNLGSVTSLGVEGEIRYQHKNSLNIGANVTYQDLRNNTKYEAGQTTESVVYRDRIPNMPYFYGNADATYTLALGPKNRRLSIGYNLLYVHAFYLYWPSRGSDKLDIPEQISHDLTLTYFFNDNLQFTLEARNIADQDLYDNFSLQKPGRSFTGKIRYKVF